MSGFLLSSHRKGEEAGSRRYEVGLEGSIVVTQASSDYLFDLSIV